MKRLLLLPLTLLFSATVFAQTNSSDSDTLKFLLSEVRLLRQDLRTTTVAAQRAQILVYRAQAQESIVRRMQERVDDTRSKLSQIQFEQRRLTVAVKQNEELLDRTDNPATRKEIEQTTVRIKAGLETQVSVEQETQTKLVESEDQLRLEQAKLSGLQDQLDRLEKLLEGFDQPR